MRVRWRNRDKGLVEGEPSTLGRARHEQRRHGGESQAGDARSDSPAQPAPPISRDMSSEPFEQNSEPVQDTGSPASPTAPPADELGSERRIEQAPRDGESAFAALAEAQASVLHEERAEVNPLTAAEGQVAEPVNSQLERLTTQIHGLQEQLDAFIARRNEAVAERASQHVASIVAAAEKSAAEIRAGAEKDAATIRERLLADVQAQVERTRAEAEADAARIRMQAHVEAARARQQAITEASAAVQAVCERLSEDLQAGARAAIAGIGGGARPSPGEAAGSVSGDETLSGPGHAAPPAHAAQITEEVQEAVRELQNAATLLEQSLRSLGSGDEQQAD